MDKYYVFVIIWFILVIILGVIMGIAVRRDRQSTQCPYCSCRDCCDIGYGIAAACSDTEQKPFVCMKQK
jgi:hypothetical protein